MLDEQWTEFFGVELKQPYFHDLAAAIQTQRDTGTTIYPPQGSVFRAFALTPFDSIKAVIVGEEPYNLEGQADGLAFSVPDNVAHPPQLVNIFRELERTQGEQPPVYGNLAYWADRGILLLNSTLTVQEGHPGSHRSAGWEKFTDGVISYINAKKTGVVFALWGNSAQKKSLLIDKKNKHTILRTSDPMPASADMGFNGCGHFNKINEVCKLW